MVAAAENGGARPAALPALPGESLTVAWVMTPPYEGSGGHTTLKSSPRRCCRHKGRPTTSA